MVEFNIAYALKQLQKAFKDNNILWLIHAGFGLYLYGINDADTHDIDIVAPTIDLKTIQKVLPKEFSLSVKPKGRKFSRGTFENECLELKYKDVSIDVLNEMVTISEGITYQSHFDKESLDRKTVFNRYLTQIPVAPIEDIVLYKLILRRGKKEKKQDLYEISRALQLGLDLNYLERKAKKVGANHLLKELDRYQLA